MGSIFSSPDWVSANDFELAVRACKEMEWILETQFGASGNGLGEKLNSCTDKFGSDKEIISHIRYINRIRNRLIHDRECNRIEQRKEFIRRCELAIAGLQRLSPKNSWLSFFKRSTA